MYSEVISAGRPERIQYSYSSIVISEYVLLRNLRSVLPLPILNFEAIYLACSLLKIFSFSIMYSAATTALAQRAALHVLVIALVFDF